VVCLLPIIRLDTRMKLAVPPSGANYAVSIDFRSRQDSLSKQTTWNGTVHSDLEEICGRLSAVEAAREESTTAERKPTGRSVVPRNILARLGLPFDLFPVPVAYIG
jgi:hypothetical protein